MRPERLLERILHEVANVDFGDLVRLVESLGFREINLQQEQGEAKQYQVRQLTALVRKNNLRLEAPE